MADIFKYSILPKLPVITHHDQLPSGSVELGRCLNGIENDDQCKISKHNDVVSRINDL